MFTEVPWYPAGFLIRLNTGDGPVVPNHPTSTATERFGIFAGSGIYGQPGLFGTNWAVADAAGDTDAGVDISTTASGAQLLFTLETDETYSMQLKRRSDGALLYSHSGNLSSPAQVQSTRLKSPYMAMAVETDSWAFQCNRPASAVLLQRPER